MRPLTEVHAVVPAGIDDPARPSGGNAYDRRVLDGLRAAGWVVTEHAVGGTWPRPGQDDLGRLAAVVAAVPAGGLLVVDGLVASCAASVLVPAAARLRLVVVVHLPLGVPDPAAAEGERQVLAAAAGVVATSAWTRRTLLDAYALAPDVVHVARPGVDVATVSPGTRCGAELLAVGAVKALKGHVDLVAALARVADLPWSCVVAGALDREPRAVDAVRRDLDRCALTGRVTLAGALGPAPLDRAYAAADLVVVPSHLETYGMVVTEALARGLPVVATDVGGVREALGDTADGPPGVLVPARRPEALADALRDWLTDAGLRRRLRARALQRRHDLAPWSATVEQVSAVLDGVGGG